MLETNPRKHQIGPEPGPNIQFLPRVLPARPYYDEFLSSIPKCQDRVFLQTMNVEFGPLVLPILDAMTERSGSLNDSGYEVPVVLKMDGNTVTQDIVKVSGHIIALMRGKRNNRWKAGRNRLEKLKEIGGKIIPTNVPDGLGFLKLYAQRNHIKLAVLDNVAYVGGINLDDDNFESEDFMVAFHDPAIVEPLAGIFERVNDIHGEDEEIVCNEYTRILLDRGEKGKSIVSDEIENMVNSARSSIRIVSQYPPDEAMRVALQKARARGVKVELILPGNVHDLTHIFNGGRSMLQEFWNNENETVRDKPLPTKYFKGPLHSKLLLVDTDLDGQGKVLFGSHNITTSMGKHVGMTELSIASTDPALVSHLDNYYQGLKERLAA